MSVPERAKVLIGLPISEMTLVQVSELLGLQASTAVDYMTILRERGLIKGYVRRAKPGLAAREVMRQRARERKAAEAARLQTIDQDLRTKLSRSVWDVYAKTIPQEEMARWFRLG